LRRRRSFRLHELALELGDAALGVAQRHVLHQHGLHQVVGRVGLLRHGAANELVGIGVLGLRALLLEAGEKSGDEIAFLRRHGCLPMNRTDKKWVAGVAAQGARHPIRHSPRLPMARNFSRRCVRSAAASMPSSGRSCVSMASPSAAIAGSRSRWAPPSGSGTMMSMTPSLSRSCAVSFNASAASCVFSPLRQMIEEQASGEITEYVECSSMSTRLAAASASAPPEPPSPMIAATSGTRSCRHISIERAIALGLRHAEIVAQAALGVGALLMREHDDAAAAEAAEPADDGAVLAEGAVAGERREIADELLDVVRAVRAVRVARKLNLLPRRELGIGLAQQAVDLGLEPRHLVGDVEIAAVGEVSELVDLAFELGQRLLEIEEVAHRA